MLFGNDLPLRLGGDCLHEVDHSVEHCPTLDERVLLLSRADEDKFGIFLTRTPLHLDEGFNGEKLVQADHLVAGRHVQAFFDYVSCD